ncbi:MAG: hypothetical protein M3O46_00405 [Myxococcota bacterium]|nr:hypothetical protein [Myxococcota bacterium]
MAHSPAAMRSLRLCTAFAIGCGSTPASSPIDAGSDALALPDAPAQRDAPVQEDVGSLAPASSVRHVLLRSGAPVQVEPSIAVSGAVLGVALQASGHQSDPFHLRFGVAAIQSDRTAGAFTFADVAETAYSPRVVSAGPRGFHIFWLTAQNSGDLRHASFDTSAQPLAPPVTLGTASAFDAAATPSGDWVAFATLVTQPSTGTEIQVGILTSASGAVSAPTPVETCSSASKPALAWSGQSIDVYYGCMMPSGAQTLRHARLDASATLLGPPATVVPGIASSPIAPPAQPSVLYWYGDAGWTKGTIDPSTGAVSIGGPSAFLITGAVRDVAIAREGPWGLETSCTMGEDLVPFGGFTVCPWDDQGRIIMPCVTFTATGCGSASIAGNGVAAFLAFDVGGNSWLLPLGAAPAPGTHLRPRVIGRAQTVKPRRVHCDDGWRCSALVDEPTVDLVAVSGPPPLQLTTDGWAEDPWPSGESSSLAWYTVDGSPSPSVVVTPSTEPFGIAPAFADRLSTTGIGWAGDGTMSFLGLDGTIAWRVALPGSGLSYQMFNEGDHFRIFQAGLVDSSGLAVLGEYVVDPTGGVVSSKTLKARPGDSPAWTFTTLAACGGAYFATGPFVGSIFRYDPCPRRRLLRLEAALTDWRSRLRRRRDCSVHRKRRWAGRLIDHSVAMDPRRHRAPCDRAEPVEPGETRMGADGWRLCVAGMGYRRRRRSWRERVRHGARRSHVRHTRTASGPCIGAGCRQPARRVDPPFALCSVLRPAIGRLLAIELARLSTLSRRLPRGV